MTDSVVVSGLGKRFPLSRGKGAHRLKEAVVHGAGKGQRGFFWALRNVSFAVGRAETFGIVGVNGAGKSTLLRLIGGVGAAEEGTIDVHGRLVGLLELASGFSTDLSGYENAQINGVVSGLTLREVQDRMASIVEFAELEDFINAPVRTYSSGMKLRLAFAVAMHTEPEVLLIDEVLAVGDIGFQKKCHTRIAELKSRGCTLILVSHDPGVIRQFCDRVLWLRKGEEPKLGAPGPIMDEMVASFASAALARTPEGVRRVLKNGTALVTRENRLGTLKAEIVDVHLYDGHGSEVHTLNSGESLVVDLSYLFHEPAESAWFQVQITRGKDKVLVTNFGCGPENEYALAKQGTVRLEIDRLELVDGQYHVDVGVYDGQWEAAYDYHEQVYPLRIRSGGPYEGLVMPPCRWMARRSNV